MSKSQNPPWLMWGTNAQVRITAPGTPVQSQQLVSIDYGRPDTWDFQFFARVVDAVGAGNVFISFDVTLGLGRTTVTLFSFETYTIALPAQRGQTIFTTAVIGADRSALVLGQNLITEVAAQTIQVVANVTATVLTSATVDVGSMWAPRTHVRPDWFGNQALGAMDR
jgi:hypothetical protein